MSQDAWGAYVATVQQLDLACRALADPDGATGRQLVATELATLRPRLADQASRLAATGVSAMELTPTSVESGAATARVGVDPARALAALRLAAIDLDRADSLIVHVPVAPTAAWPRNLLVYAPFALVAALVELVLYAASGAPASVYAQAWGVGMPILAFVLGWVMVGLVFPPAADGAARRTPGVGAVVCAVPLLFALLTLL
ncbi:hypothetical protein [Pilimelia columellifera]|uniref:Uncharacterized protein n=1 Tax=Pilimelia columellifera subsp. columellifera TaxID=706583 RepID=A0ABN3NCP7_9ACTN